MSAPITAQDMVTRVNERCENRLGGTYTPAEVLRAIDDAVNDLYLVQQERYQDHELDYIDVNFADTVWDPFHVDSGQGIEEFQLPAYIYRIRLIEDTNQTEPVEIPHGSLAQKELAREAHFLRQVQMHWIWIRGSSVRGRIGFIGGATALSQFRIYFVRRLPPLHWGSVGATTNVARIELDVLTPSLTRTGRALLTADAYIGALVQLNDAAIPLIDGQIRRLTTYTGAITYQSTFDEVLAAAPDVAPATSPYSLIPQIDPEFHELAILKAAFKLATVVGGMQTMDALSAEKTERQMIFDSATQVRQSQTPEYVDWQEDFD